MRPLAYDLVYKQKNTRDERSAVIIDILFDNIYIDFETVYNFGGLENTLESIIFKDKPMASTIEKVIPAAKADIEKVVESW